MGLLDILNNNAANYVLAQQADVNTMITTENTRLNTKANSIQQAKDSQDRLVSLNQNYSSRYNQYNYIIIIIVVALVLFLGITLIQRNMEDPPTGLFTFLTVLIFGGAFIYIIMIYSTIMSRSNMDYEQLNIPAPLPAKSAGSKSMRRQAAGETGDLLGSIMSPEECVGQSCCIGGTLYDDTTGSCRPDCSLQSSNTIWDGYASTPKCISVAGSCESTLKTATSNVCDNPCSPGQVWNGSNCIPIPKQPFTTMSSSNSIQPYSSNEYESYAPV